MAIFKYGQAELDYLKKRDQQLGLAIDRIGPVEREVIPDLFAALVNSIVSQQISAPAAATVWNRMRERFGAVTPPVIAAATMDEIQQCGLSNRKAGYIKGIAESVAGGGLDLAGLAGLSDAEIIGRLVTLKGVGRWTAEMLLIFSLNRPNVVSWDDLAIRRGMINLYGLKTLTKARFERYRKRYSPYGSVASLYLWAISKE